MINFGGDSIQLPTNICICQILAPHPLPRSEALDFCDASAGCRNRPGDLSRYRFSALHCLMLSKLLGSGISRIGPPKYLAIDGRIRRSTFLK